ncbi:SUMO protease [Achlya hypogyna]|uniref:SUMO protease n=1 Tax=Achlya hypogyna TaxID=1202772 RepID=A0A1V9ZGF6_ACHHY|nr:SUMO protease [Achlya hypogyna]
MAAECAKTEADAWRLQRRLEKALAVSDGATVATYVATERRASKAKLSRHEYWKLLHGAIPSEYVEESIVKKKPALLARPSSDPFGVKIVKQQNQELLRQLAITMGQLPRRKTSASPAIRPLERQVQRKIDRVLGDEMAYYDSTRHRQTDEIAEIEAQLAKYRIDRESGAIERAHDAWIAERQWTLLLEEVVAEELDDLFDEAVDEVREEGPDLVLSPEDEEAVDDALSGGSASEVLCQKFNVDITRGLLQCLRPGQWLNDEIINFYFQMLAERDISVHAALGIAASHFFNSFFFSKVSEGGYNFVNVRRWTRKIDLFAMDKIFIPVNIRNVHWCLAVIFMTEKRIQYYDSMNGAGTECLNVLLRYLGDEHQHKKGAPFDASGWELLPSQPDTPQQGNSHDCGMFTCMFADYLAQNKELTFRQRNMAFFRRRMVLRTVEGSIPDDEDFE